MIYLVGAREKNCLLAKRMYNKKYAIEGNRTIDVMKLEMKNTN